jgi:hypothetical protein
MKAALSMCTLLLTAMVMTVPVEASSYTTEYQESVVTEQHPARRETIVEPPVVEHREIVIHEPVETRHIVVQAPVLRGCMYFTSRFASGSLYCRDGYRYQCDNGVWVSTDESC